MSSFIKFFLLFFSCCVCAQAESIKNKKVFEYFAKAALFEFCGKRGVDVSCKQVNDRLEDLEGEVKFFDKYNSRKVLVIFNLSKKYPYVILSYNKDGYLEIVNRGIWLESKFDFIAGFVEEGSLTE